MTINTILLPGDLNEIPYATFFNCTSLKTLYIPSNVKKIDAQVFAGCSALQSINIPESVDTIMGGAFTNCKALTEVHIDNLKKWCSVYIGGSMPMVGPFANGIADLYVQGNIVKDLEIPEGVEVINPYVFYGSRIETLKLPNSLKRIEYSAFNNCALLKTVYISNNIDSIGSSAFNRCGSMTAVYMEDLNSWCNIGFKSESSNPLFCGKSLYLNGKLITSLEIPNGVECIQDYAFTNCNINSVVIPETLRTIGKQAFNGCNMISSVYISDINKWCNITFEDNPIARGNGILYLNGEQVQHLDLKDVKNINARTFEGCSGIRSVAFTDVEVIGSYAFKNCSDLIVVELPNSLKQINYGAFDSGKIKEIHCENKYPLDISESVFQSVDKSECFLYVPPKSASLYSNADVWMEFSHIVQEGIILNVDTLSLLEGVSTKLNAYNSSGIPIDNNNLVWESSDEGVVVVNEDGTIITVSEGQAIVSATTINVDQFSAQCLVKVIPKTFSFEIEEKELTMTDGEKKQIKVVITPSNATNIFIWESKNTDVAVVDTAGWVTAVGVGTAIIKATSTDGTNLSDSCKITVLPVLVSSVSLNKENVILKNNESLKLEAKLTPENASNKIVVWESLNADIVTVSSEGLLKGVGIGTTKVVVTTTDGTELSDTCIVSVEPIMISSMSLNKTSATLNVGDNLFLAVAVKPNDATNKSVSWKSSDETIATVNANGVVTALSLGETVITVTATDGSGVSATCVVTVVPTKVSSVSLSETSATLNKGESLTLTATVKPDDVTDKSVDWTSSDETVATVSEDGVVTAIGTGTAEITATASDGSGQSATCVVTVSEQVTIIWNQKFEAVVGDAIQLLAEASDGRQVMFRAVAPNGGYVTPELVNDNGVWSVTFNRTGAVILEAYVEGTDEYVQCEPVCKTFNVLPDREVLLIDGIYYRYTDYMKRALSVTSGYRQYEGNIVVLP